MGARWLSSALVVAVALAAPAHAEPSVPTFTRGVAYTFNGGKEMGSDGWCASIRSGEALCSSASEPRTLSAAHLRRVQALLASPPPPRAAQSRCWNPHHALELFDGDGRRHGVDVCFECDKLDAGELVPAQRAYLPPNVRATLRLIFAALRLSEPRAPKKAR